MTGSLKADPAPNSALPKWDFSVLFKVQQKGGKELRFSSEAEPGLGWDSPLTGFFLTLSYSTTGTMPVLTSHGLLEPYNEMIYDTVVQ